MMVKTYPVPEAFAAGAMAIVDGVSYAPHGLPDVDALGADRVWCVMLPSPFTEPRPSYAPLPPPLSLFSLSNEASPAVAGHKI